MSHWHPSPEFDEILSDILDTADMDAMRLFGKFKATAHLMGHLARESRKEEQLSPARMRLLIRLAIDERAGTGEGLSPSELSRYSGVSRNTISALLNGLEEQALIERRLNPSDRRKFKIRITESGQETVLSLAPEFARFVSSVFAPLSAEEQATLQNLLDKVLKNLIAKAAEMGLHTPAVTPNESPENDDM